LEEAAVEKSPAARGVLMTLLSLERIDAALRTIDPVFLNSPLVRHDELDREAGCAVMAKVETLNPIRSFKGRGADFFVQNLSRRERPLVAASAGNFGQGLAFASAKVNLPLTIFAARTASPVKITAMRRMGAKVRLVGIDLDEAKSAARRYAEKKGLRFVEDGGQAAFAEGAGTIACELAREPGALDAIFVPLGNGALVSGIGAWMRHAAPHTKVIGVVAEGARAMELSFQQKRVIETAQVNTIADGIAIRVPIPFALRTMLGNVDEVIAVSDESMIRALRLIHRTLGIVVEPAGAAGLAAALEHRERFRGHRIATVLCGANITKGQMREWMLGAVGREKHRAVSGSLSTCRE
jgi:threonine dehydratase